ncbi:MAG: protease modulator HflK [Sedimentisphaerales bacterium]|nr:protease modulator HflK [Sedimentisphaerales bacterium]
MKLSPKQAEHRSLIAFAVQIVFSIILFLLSGWSESMAIALEGWHFLGGSIIWLVLYLQFRQKRLAEEEKLDAEQYKRLRREGKDTSVFGSKTPDEILNLAERRLDWLEKYLLPIFSLLLTVYLLGLGLWKYYEIQSAGVRVLAQDDVLKKTSAIIVLLALLSFLFARYTIGMSRQVVWRPLRAGGSYLQSNALICFALAITLLIGKSRVVRAEEIATYVLAILMIVIGIEVLLNLILDAYRPRIQGRYRQAAFESRLLGLFSEPGGILRTAAHALDYQFGFKVSETWFFRLLARAVVPLLLFQAVVLYLFTGLQMVPPGHVGVLERFGKPLNIKNPYQSGLHIKLPWPMDKIRTFPVDHLQVIDVGFVRKDPTYDEQGRKTPDLTPILWSVEHWKEELPYMVALPRFEQEFGDRPGSSETEKSISRDDFDMLVVALTIHFRIKDVSQYGYNENSYQDPRAMLEAISYRLALHYCANSTIESLLGPGRHQTTNTLKNQIQSEADLKNLGIHLEFVGLESVHPPLQVAEAFEKVVSTLQEKQATILKARGDAISRIEQAMGLSSQLNSQARAYAFERAALAQADSNRFSHQNDAYTKGNNVYLWREYLSVLDETLPNMRKYVITSENVDSWIYELDLKEKLETDLFTGLGIPEKQEK